MIGTYIITLYMSNGNIYEFKTKNGIEDFWQLELTDGFAQIDEDVWVNPMQIASIEVKSKLW